MQRIPENNENRATMRTSFPKERTFGCNEPGRVVRAARVPEPKQKPIRSPCTDAGTMFSAEEERFPTERVRFLTDLSSTWIDRFIAREGDGVDFERSQRDVTFGGGTGAWIVSYDALVELNVGRAVPNHACFPGVRGRRVGPGGTRGR